MEQNIAHVHCYEKILEIKFNGERHLVNLMQGDLHDNWNGITDLNGDVWDINLHWDEENMEIPSLIVYSVDEDGVTDFFSYDEIPTSILGTKEQYFKK